MDAVVSGVGVEEVSYHQNTVRTQFDHQKTDPSTVVIATLAAAKDVEPIELEPLYDAVDPDALDAIVRIRKGTNGDIRVSFTHEGHAITVFSYGMVTVTPGDEPTSADHGGVAGT